MRKFRYLMITVALLCSGAYLFVYLYRWEWHRALVAGLFFVAAEVGLATAAILDRLRAMEQRLGQGHPVAATVGANPSRPDLGVLGRLEQTAPGPRINFEWLSSRPGSGMSVFVPILLGAGVVLSGMAWLVERASRLTARPALERGLADRMAVFDLPSGTLTGRAAAATASHRHGLLVHLVAAVAAIAVATAGLDAMSDATQNRPDALRSGTASSVVMTVASRPDRPTLAASQALWGACTTQLGRRHRVLSMTDLGGGRVQVVVQPEIATYAERRLRGCIADGTTDKIRASVQEIELLVR